MSFSDDVKLKAQSALKPYLCEECPSPVKNPILLLNYLHQHAIISSPKYFVVGLQNHLQHAVTCKIDDLQMIGNGNTNKVAKSNAAQQFLDLLLKPVNISCVYSSPNSVTSLAQDTSGVYASVHINNGRNVSKICASSLNTEYQNDNCVLNGVNQSTPTTYLVKPQSSTNEIAQIHFQSNVFLENIAMDTSKTPSNVSVSKFQMASNSRKLMKRKSNRNSDKFSKGTFQVNSFPVAHQQLNFDDFFNPFFNLNMSKSRSKVSLNTFQIALSPSTQQSDRICEDALGMNTSCSIANDQANCDDFFDPFFKQRPTNCNIPIVMETKHTEDHIKNQTYQSNYADNSPNVMESKNVFALLQKKTQKHLKLIPRFQIESVESGFRCSVRIGSYHASGEGRNKKEAKTKAAVNLLSEIKDLD